MPITSVHVMRHGEVDNPQGVLYERLPGFGLAQRGQEMISITATWLADTNRDIAAIFASPLQRAQESAVPATKIFNLPVQADSCLTETGNKFRGQQISRGNILTNPRYWPRCCTPWLPNWGEHFRDIAPRMSRVTAYARVHTPTGQECLVVSHQLPIWMLRRLVEGKPLIHDPRQRQCVLASVTGLHLDGSTLIGWEYASPAADLVATASDMAPGNSSVAANRGTPNVTE